MHIALEGDLPKEALIEGNVLSSLEKEVGVNMTPSEFANTASITISIEKARNILIDMGFDIPSSIKDKSQLDNMLRSSPRLNVDDIEQFIQKARN